MGKPKIRFEGYSEDWEQRKLGELGEILTGSTPSTSNSAYYSEDGIPWVTPTDINELTISDTPRKLSEEGAKVGRVVPANTILCTCIASIGKNALLTVKGSFNQQINSLTPSAGNDAYFLLTESELWSNKMKRIAASGTMQIVNKTEFSELDTLVPLTDEQKKIGSYFRNLDHLITLHQRKCDEIKTLKKYMLQKMFPQNGEKVPEIRFDGFTEDWEQRKLGDIAEFSKGSGYSKGDLIESGTPIILYGRLYTKYENSISEVDTYVEAKDGSVYSKGGEVIVPASGETAEDIARAATVDKSGVILGGDLNVVSPNEDINSAFLAISISHGNSKRELAKKAQGKSVVHIHNEEIKNLVVPFPAKAEQNKIVEYFSNLDDLITLHQRKCNELKEIKKYMLQNMFV